VFNGDFKNTVAGDEIAQFMLLITERQTLKVLSSVGSLNTTVLVCLCVFW
jgi:hypothetical protein